MQLPLFYKKVVPLSREQHKNLYIEPVEGFGFAAGSNSLYIAAVEFPRAAREYPIVFGKDAQGNVFPVVLLGLKKNQNVFVNKKGEWKADYIPAYARRYPFILATPDAGKDQFAVCIDESYAGFNTAKEGQALFNAKGEQSKSLKQAVDFLKDYQKHVRLTATFCKELVDSGLLEPMQANIALKSGEKLTVGGFQCVKREKLKALPPKKILDLLKSDQLELIYLHLESLNNVGALTAKAA
ncbi:MAG: SapC family protein [Gammaproteobacteria bacterium]|nr:SapC family protein [Gammaproteobacteria bacterium]